MTSLDDAIKAIEIANGLSEEEWQAREERLAKQQAEREARDREENEKAKRKGYRERGFPLRSLQAAWHADETKPAILRIEEWHNSAESILVLSGPAGCGKTVAATWWAWHKAPWSRFLRSTTFAASSRYDHEQRTQWLRCNELVLDDLGTEFADAKGNYQVDLDELVDVFYGDMKRLVITTNCTREEFKKRYGERITDRIRESGSWFSISSESLRRKS